MGDFLPEEYCTIEAAIETAVAAWYPQELGKTTVTADDRQYLEQNAAQKFSDREDDRVKEIRKRFEERSRLRDQSFERLRQIMFKGTLPTYFFADSREILPFPSVSWGDDDADEARRRGAKEIVEKAGRICIGRVVIAKTELENVLAGRPAHEPTSGVGIGASSAAVETAEIRNTGRKPNFDWMWVVIEAARIVYYEGPPKSRSDLIDRVLTQYGNTFGEAPSVSSAKPHISKLWKHLTLDEK